MPGRLSSAGMGARAKGTALLSSDRLTGSLVAALGALTIYGGSVQPGVPGQDVGPSVFPILIGLGMVLCGTLVALGIGRTFEAPDPGGPDDAAETPPRFAEARAFIPPALLLFYVLAVEALGFLLTAATIALVLSLAMGARLRLALPIALLAPLAIHLVFYRLLRVPLPEGLLAAPW